MAMPEAEPTAEEVQEMHASIADVYDKAAGQAFRDGEYGKALLFIGVCRNMDPSRTALWQQRAFTVKNTETQQYPAARTDGAAPARLGRGKDDPAIRPVGGAQHALQDPEME